MQRSPDPDGSPADLQALLEELTAIRTEMVAETNRLQAPIQAVHDNFRESACNLLHYLALRRHDLRALQVRLAARGLSSLGRAESHALATVDAVLETLHRLGGIHWHPPVERGVDFSTGQRLLSRHSRDLLGPAPPGRDVRIMVTMPREAADDEAFIHHLLQQGMDCLRINCAHDDAEIWGRIIHQLRRAERALGRSCRVVMDLAGPKLRTGPIEPGPEVVKVRPQRDAFGRVQAPARLWLVPDNGSSLLPPADATCIPMPEAWLARLRTGDRLTLTDARDARRTLMVVEASPAGCWVEASQTLYLVPGTILRLQRGRAKGRRHEASVGQMEAKEQTILLREGDQLVLTRDLNPGRRCAQD